MGDLTAEETLWGYPEGAGPTSPRPEGMPLIVVRFADDETDEDGNLDPSWCVHYFEPTSRVWRGAVYGYDTWAEAMADAAKEASHRAAS